MCHRSQVVFVCRLAGYISVRVFDVVVSHSGTILYWTVLYIYCVELCAGGLHLERCLAVVSAYSGTPV